MLAENVLWLLNLGSRRPENNLGGTRADRQGHARPRADTAATLRADRSGCELYASLQRDPATVAIPVLFLHGGLPPVPDASAEVPGLPIAGLLHESCRTGDTVARLEEVA